MSNHECSSCGKSYIRCKYYRNENRDTRQYILQYPCVDKPTWDDYNCRVCYMRSMGRYKKFLNRPTPTSQPRFTVKPKPKPRSAESMGFDSLRSLNMFPPPSWL